MNNNQTLVVGIIILAIVGVVAYSLSKNGVIPSPSASPSISSMATTEPTATPTNIPLGWKIYKNEDVGIEFSYPEVLGETEVSYIDNTNKNSDNMSTGKKINVLFKKNGNYEWISFAAFTSDYKGFKDFVTFKGNDNINSECLKPLSYNNQGEACKIIETAEIKAIWKNFLIGDECAISFGSQIYFNNKNSSIYKGLQFIIHLEDAEAKVNKLYNCSDEVKIAQSNAEAMVQSKNIMERKNLSEKDLQRLNIVDQILSSFKFIK